MESSYMQKPDWNSGRIIEIDRLKKLIIKRVEIYAKRIKTIMKTNYKDVKNEEVEITRVTKECNRELKKHENKILRLEMEVRENVER